jgi:hypothetical protein
MRQNKGFLELRRLEAAREIANILATSGNRVMLDSQGLLLNGRSSLLKLTTYLFHFSQSQAVQRKRFSRRRGRSLGIVNNNIMIFVILVLRAVS